MPMDHTRYPPDWKQISLRIRARDGNRCKWCGVTNGALGYRDPDGKFWTDEEIDRLADGDCSEGKPWRRVKIVLTVAHLGTSHLDGRPGDKHDKLDVRDENLAALCSQCHLRYDRDEHTQNAAKTRRQRKIAAGQIDMGLL